MSCPLTSTLSFEEFFSSRRRPDGTYERMPVNMGLELTHRCNLSCVHCYLQGAEPDEASPSAREMTTLEVEHLIDEAADLGVLWMLMTGGDPMVRSDFAHLYLYARRAGIFVSLFLNGTLITDEAADLFEEYPPTFIEITLHSMDPSVFDSITRVPGSFEKCIAGIERLKSRGLRFNLKSVALRGNVEGLAEVEEYARRLDVGYRFDSNVMPLRATSVPPEGQRLTPREVVALDRRFPKRMDAWSEVYRLAGKGRTDRVFTCGAGLKGFWVDPAGRMTMCALTDYVTYDLREGTLAEAWSRFIPTELLRTPRPESKCRGCDMDTICGRCPGWSASESGDLEEPVPYLCEIGRIRREAILEHRGLEAGHTQHVDIEAVVGSAADSSLSR